MKAEYIDHMGDDIRVVNAARVSFAKEAEWIHDRFNDTWHIDTKDVKLIDYLADHNHWTPFAHCMVTMRETMPIFIARQRFKHMVGFTYNEVSRRYVDTPPEFYTPWIWRKKAENKKQGSSDEEVIFFKELTFYGERESISKTVAIHQEETLGLYNDMIASGVCPEQARMVLPQSMMTSYYVTGSLAAWARAYTQRTHEHAQREWDEITPQWDEIIRPLFPHAWSALVDG
jgi:thymidylate synthase (FAD)